MAEQALRKIIHIDMDAFYASVEQRDEPRYRGKPLAVGGSKERGVVAAASYEARRYGVKSAMPSALAYRKCPDIIFVKPRFDVYKAVSDQIRAIFLEYTDLVEPLSLDEAYLDVTQNKIGLPSATLIAKRIKAQIKAQVQLTASAGISVNKFLAKVASDMDKPDGLYLIGPDQVNNFVGQLAIEKFHGIGKVTAQKMKSLGIHTGQDLRQHSEAYLVKHFGKAGRFFYAIAMGNDERPVNPHRIRKSIGAERTFDQDVPSAEAAATALQPIAEKLAERLKHSGTGGTTLTLKVKFNDFTQITRSKTLPYSIRTLGQIRPLYIELLQELDQPLLPMRLLGLSISNLDTEKMAHGIGLQLTIDF